MTIRTNGVAVESIIIQHLITILSFEQDAMRSARDRKLYATRNVAGVAGIGVSYRIGR